MIGTTVHFSVGSGEVRMTLAGHRVDREHIVIDVYDGAERKGFRCCRASFGICMKGWVPMKDLGIVVSVAVGCWLLLYGIKAMPARRRVELRCQNHTCPVCATRSRR